MLVAHHALEVSTSLLIEAVSLKLSDIFALFLLGLNSLLLSSHFSIDLHVELEQMVNGVFLQCFLAAIFLICQSEKSVLFTPVSQICKRVLVHAYFNGIYTMGG